MDLGEKIKLRIEELGISSRQVALRAGISPGFLSDLQKGQKTDISVDTAKKLAEALDWPVGELIDVDPERVERWFWTSRIGSMAPQHLADLQTGSSLQRMAWTLQQVRRYYPDADLPSLIQASAGHVEQLLAGEGAVSDILLHQATIRLDLPPHWLGLGEPAPSERLIQQILQHHNATDWLKLVAEAMDKHVPPDAIRRMMQTFLDIANPGKK